MSHLVFGGVKGFNLIELMVVILIIAVISAIGGVAFLPQLRNMEAQMIENELKNFLVTGKQNALIYHTPILLCVADANYHCQVNDGEFLLSFIDKNTNHQFDSGTDTLIGNRQLTLHFGSLATRVALNKNYIQINPSTGNPIGYMGHIKYCPTNREQRNMFKVTFGITGLIKTKRNNEDPTECG